MTMRKQQKYDQCAAIKQLNYISSGETRFLEDWATAKIASCQSFQPYYESPKLDYYQNKNLLNSQTQMRQVIQPRKTNVNFRMKSVPKSSTKKQAKQQQIFIPKFKDFNILSPRTKNIKKIDNISVEQLQQKKQYITISRLIGREQKQPKQQGYKQKYQQNVKRSDENKQTSKKSHPLNQTGSFRYLLQLKNQSMLNIKLEEEKKKSFEENFNHEEKYRVDSRRMNDILKNKIRRKRTNKFLVIKTLNQSSVLVEKGKKDSQSLDKIAVIANSIEQNNTKTNEVKLLKNWLDSNRYKKKRSVGSLLKQHFDTKIIEQQKFRERERASLSKSIKFLTLLSQRNKNIL